MAHSLYVGNDHRVTLTGEGRLTDHNGDPITGASVTMTLYNLDDETEVAGASWPVSFTELGDGEYDGQLPAEIKVDVGEPYKLVIKASTANSEAQWTEIVTAQWRSFWG